MKKLIFSLLAFALFGLFFAPSSFAATIYSNDFTGSLSDFTGTGTTPVQSDCTTSSNGVTCATLEPALVYRKGYSTLKCVAVDIMRGGSGVDQVRLGSNGAEFGIDLFHNVGITFGAVNPNNIALTSANPNVSYDTGVAIPSGTHTYMVCNDPTTTTFTVYLDNTQIFSQQIVGATALYDHGWVQVTPGDYMKNFVMSGDVNLLSTYTNDFTGSLSGFTGPGTNPLQSDCTTSSSGLSCATDEPAIVYDTAFYNLQCVQVDITHNGTGVNQIRLGNYKTGFNNVGITFGAVNPNNIALTSANPNVSYDTGVAIPSGTHTYKLCNDAPTDTFTLYLDGSQILSQQISGIVAAYQYGWLQLTPGDYMKNFILTGAALPNMAPQITMPSSTTINEGSTYAATGSFSDPDSTSWNATVDYGDPNDPGILPLTLNADKTFSLSHVYKDNGTYTVTVTVADDQSATGQAHATESVNNVNPAVGTITAPTSPVAVNTAITASASFTDPGVLDTHTATWNWGDGNTTTGTVTESNGSGSVSDNHTYSATGVYTITLMVTDKDGGQSSSSYQYVSVYDANTSFAGGRSFNNPSSASPSTSGKVTFGISSKYSNTGTLTGSAKLSFKAANIDFASTSVTSLATSNGKAYLRGNGTVNGFGTYTFLATGIDGSVVGGNDLIRVRIKNSSGTVIYDSQPGASDTTDPTTVVASGNIRIQ